jgi:hypothetical protein
MPEGWFQIGAGLFHLSGDASAGIEIEDQQLTVALADASLGGVSPSPDSWRED